MQLTRVCQKCRKIITYKCTLTYNRANKKNTLCCGCRNRASMTEEVKERIRRAKIGKKQSIESNIKRSKTLKGRIFSKEHREKIGNAHRDKIVSLETRLKLSKCRKGVPWTGHHTEEFKKQVSNRFKNNNVWRGKKHTEQTKRKQRLVAIERLSKNYFNGHQVIPAWNPVACQKIDEYGKKFGYNFQHAMNGGEFYIEELGYWVDGYDKEKNTVIEYYEKKHHNKQVKKDLDRETEICNHLSCDFIILWEK